MTPRLLRAARRPWRELWQIGLDSVLDRACAACGAAGAELCDGCERRLRRRGGGGARCARCGEPTVPGRGCTADHRALRHLVRLVAPLRYAGTGGALVRRFKLDADPAAGLVLAREMRQAWKASTTADWRRAVLVAVPLHRTRRRRRGFDQAAWLAAHIGADLGWIVASGVLVRDRATRAQGDPRTTSRERNVAGAFRLGDGRAVTGRRVVVVDDVVTSGATLRECAAVLRAARAREVAALVACRS